MSKTKIVTGIVVLALIAAGVYYFFSYHFIPKEKEQLIEQVDTLAAEIEIPTLYDIPIDSFRVVEGKILPNQTLGNLFARYHLPDGAGSRLIEIPKNVFDLGKIRAGNKYVLFFENDSLETLRYFVYEHTFTDYYKICFSDDSVYAEGGQKKSEYCQKKNSGKNYNIFMECYGRCRGQSHAC